ncbi:MAG: hypothetical protein ABEI77_03710 [Halorientalis sp.]
MSDADDGSDDRFAIPRHPQRRYPYNGGVEYDGETVFRLVPTPDQSDEQLQRLVEGVLAGERYTYGDWFDLPMPLYLVNDERTGDVFRVSVRDGTIRLHVLPATESAGLRGLFEQVEAVADVTWRVECHVE